MPEKFKRTHYLTDFSLQLPYVALNFAVLAAFLGLSVWIVYVTSWSQLVERLSDVYPQGRLAEILGLIYLRLTIGFLCLVPLVVAATLFLSHTMAGPLVRIKRYLKLMAKGEFDLGPLALRRFDELKDVADLVNQITSQMGPRFHERKRLIASLQTTVQALRSDVARLPSAGQEIHRKVNYLNDTLKILE